MKFFSVFFISLLFVSAIKAQKSKYVGHYLLGKPSRDTIDGHLFISIDSFKFIYQVTIKNGTDYAYPVYTGSWSADDSKHIIFNFKDGRVRTALLSLNTYSSASLLRITLGDNVYTRSPTDEQMQGIHSR